MLNLKYLKIFDPQATVIFFFPFKLSYEWLLLQFCYLSSEHCSSVLEKQVVADFLKAFEGFVSNNNNEKYWCILLWLVLFGFYLTTRQWTESLSSSQFSLWCKWGSQSLRSDSGLTWPKLLLFLHSPKQRMLSGSRMHTTKMLLEVATSSWCSVGVSSRQVLRLIWKWNDFEAGITGASAECATLKVKHSTSYVQSFERYNYPLSLQVGLFNFHWIILME